MNELKGSAHDFVKPEVAELSEAEVAERLRAQEEQDIEKRRAEEEQLREWNEVCVRSLTCLEEEFGVTVRQIFEVCLI